MRRAGVWSSARSSALRTIGEALHRASTTRGGNRRVGRQRLGRLKGASAAPPAPPAPATGRPCAPPLRPRSNRTPESRARPTPARIGAPAHRPAQAGDFRRFPQRCAPCGPSGVIALSPNRSIVPRTKTQSRLDAACARVQHQGETPCRTTHRRPPPPRTKAGPTLGIAASRIGVRACGGSARGAAAEPGRQTARRQGDAAGWAERGGAGGLAR